MELCYTLKDFEMIGVQETVLSRETLSTIQKLCELIGFPTESTNFVNQYNNTAASSNTNNRQQKDIEYRGDKHFNRNQVKRPQKGNNDGWKTATVFKATKFAELNDNEALISEIRTAMNKLTDTNYADKIASIIEKLNELQEESTEDIKKVLETIYAITISNKMYVDTYVKVWSAVFNDFGEEATKLFERKISEYKESMNNIVDVNTENYDEFCDFTTKNTNRKNTTTFLCKLVGSGLSIFTNDRLLLLTDQLMDHIEIAIETKEKQKEMEELTENIIIIFSKMKTNVVEFSRYLPRIQRLAGYKTGEKPGLPPRSKFKYLDLVGK